MRWSRFTPPVNFVTIHCKVSLSKMEIPHPHLDAYILFMAILSLAVLYPAGNLKAVDAFFFGASASTESGLNTVDVKDLYTYQQLYIYFIPMFTHLGFINAFTVLVRLFWFRKHLQKVAPKLLTRRQPTHETEQGKGAENDRASLDNTSLSGPDVYATSTTDVVISSNANASPNENGIAPEQPVVVQRITFDPAAHDPRSDSTLYIPSPREREQGYGPTAKSQTRMSSRDDLSIHPDGETPSDMHLRRRRTANSRLSAAQPADGVVNFAKSLLILDSGPSQPRNSLAAEHGRSSSRRASAVDQGLALSRHATIGRNSDFKNLTEADREKIGGLEYRSLQLLLKVVFSYFFGLHLFGAICLVGWIQYANSKYTDYLAEMGQNPVWWAFYSAQTMVDNLGFTLTPDSMISFRDAPWPMIAMSFLAFAGNTLYPVFLRLVIWTISKVTPKKSRIQEPVSFLLAHPRRCYTLLFPSRVTWILFGIIFALNFVDTLLIIVLDLDNPEVNVLPVGKRILGAVFQAASSRHTGTASFNLANVSPAVQFSLMIMMYIAIFPIALSIRASNTYEERTLGVYSAEGTLDEDNGRSYILNHMANQLNFDLWYIFLGIFILCIAESKRIADVNEPAFTVWTIFFEVTSAYGNVGLSLGYPTVMTSLSGMFSTFGKLVICAMMIRGRHRGLPYMLDRAIMLPDEQILGLRGGDEEAEA